MEKYFIYMKGITTLKQFNETYIFKKDITK